MKPKPDAVSPEQIVRYALDGLDGPHIVVGPVVHRPECGTYFIIAGHGPTPALNGRPGFRCDQIIGGSEERLTVLAILCGMARGKVVHNMACELSMARLCEQLWPEERTRKIRAQMEAESDMDRAATAGSPSQANH